MAGCAVDGYRLSVGVEAEAFDANFFSDGDARFSDVPGFVAEIDGAGIEGFIYVFQFKHLYYLRVLSVLQNILLSSKEQPGRLLPQVQTAASEDLCRFPSR